jgi:hypothetical protein
LKGRKEKKHERERDEGWVVYIPRRVVGRQEAAEKGEDAEGAMGKKNSKLDHDTMDKLKKDTYCEFLLLLCVTHGD